MRGQLGRLNLVGGIGDALSAFCVPFILAVPIAGTIFVDVAPLGSFFEGAAAIA